MKGLHAGQHFLETFAQYQLEWKVLIPLNDIWTIIKLSYPGGGQKPNFIFLCAHKSNSGKVFHTVLSRKARRERITRYWYLHHYCNLRETVTISILQGLRPSLGVTGYALSKSLILRWVLVSLSSAMKFTGLMGAPSVDIDINVTSRVESGEISNPLGFPLSGLRRTVRPTSFVTHREAQQILADTAEDKDSQERNCQEYVGRSCPLFHRPFKTVTKRVYHLHKPVGWESYS